MSARVIVIFSIKQCCLDVYFCMNLIKRTVIKSMYLIQIVCLIFIFSLETIAQINFRNIHIVSQVNNEKVATDGSQIIDIGDVVRLYLADKSGV